MSLLQETLDQYLAMRRALGHKLCQAGRLVGAVRRVRRSGRRDLRHHRPRIGMGEPALWGAALRKGPSLGYSASLRTLLRRARSTNYRAAARPAASSRSASDALYLS
jgi:hypothetical protein